MSSTESEEVQPDKDEKENNNENLSCSCFRQPFFVKLLKLYSPEKFYLIVGSLCSLLYGGVEPAVALLYSIIYRLLAYPNLEDQSVLTRNLSLGIFGIYVFAGILQFLSTVTFTKAGEALTLRLRLLTFETILRREMSWFDEEKNSVGLLVTRLSNDTAALKVRLKSIDVFL
jgi:ABC-type multidrug transport system fused ATPase/permease subunit